MAHQIDLFCVPQPADTPCLKADHNGRYSRLSLAVSPATAGIHRPDAASRFPFPGPGGKPAVARGNPWQGGSSRDLHTVRTPPPRAPVSLPLTADTVQHISAARPGAPRLSPA